MPPYGEQLFLRLCTTNSKLLPSKISNKILFLVLIILIVFRSQEASSITVVTGTNELDSGGDSYQVENIISHPLYIAFTITNDIGLIKLKKPIDFKENVQPIKLPTKNTTSGTELTLSGWGTITVIIIIILMKSYKSRVELINKNNYYFLLMFHKI